MINIRVFPTLHPISAKFSSSVYEGFLRNFVTIPGPGVTCICIERDGDGGDGGAIIRIVRSDNSRTPAVIYSRSPTPPSHAHSDPDQRRSSVTHGTHFSSRNSRQMAVMVETTHIACQTENDADESLGCSFCRQMAVMTETRFAACQTEFSAGDSSSKNGRQSAVIVNTRIAACQTEADEYARLVVDQTKTIAGLERARGKKYFFGFLTCLFIQVRNIMKNIFLR